MNRWILVLLLCVMTRVIFADWDRTSCPTESCLQQGVSDATQVSVPGNTALPTGGTSFIPPQGNPSRWRQQASALTQQSGLDWVARDFSHLDTASAQSLRQQVDSTQTTTTVDPVSCSDGSCLQALLPTHPATASSRSSTKLYLSMMQSMQQERDPSGLTVFPGKAVDCVDNGTLVGSSHCCHSGVGALQSFWRRACSPVDQMIEQAREAGTATYMGAWKSCAAHTAFGICIRRQQHYAFCIWPSVLARIVQEQGHAQLGQNLSATCAGLTLNPDQLARIRLDQLDYRDYWAHQP